MIRSDVVVGLRYGDEGKGKIVAALCASGNYDYCVRYNGGPNAGHTVYKGGVKLVTHSIPTGILYGIPSFIGPGCVVNLKGFLDELQTLQEVLPEYDLASLIRIAPEAHIVTEELVEEDKREDKIGSTGQGIAPTYAAKMKRTGIRAHQSPLLQSFLGHPQFTPYYNKRVLFEGAQGFELDPDLGQYPYVTSSSGLPGNIGNVVPITSLDQVIGVAKVYDTYVGNNPLFEMVTDPVFEKIRELGKEYGATTGRPRKVQWLDLPRLFESILMSGATTVYINKIDILREVGVWKLSFASDGDFEPVECIDEADFRWMIKDYISTLPWTVELIFSGDPNGI